MQGISVFEYDDGSLNAIRKDGNKNNGVLCWVRVDAWRNGDLCFPRAKSRQRKKLSVERLMRRNDVTCHAKISGDKWWSVLITSTVMYRRRSVGVHLHNISNINLKRLIQSIGGPHYSLRSTRSSLWNPEPLSCGFRKTSERHGALFFVCSKEKLYTRDGKRFYSTSPQSVINSTDLFAK